MSKKSLLGLAFGAGLVVFLTVLYLFYPGGAPQVGPTKPETPGDVQYRTAPEFAGKPAPPEAGAPPAQEPPPPPLAKASPSPAEAPAPPEMKPPAAQELPPPPSKPEEHYGLLVGRYRTYKEASKVLEKLKKKDKPGFVRHDGRQRKPYAVWAGPFPTQQESQVAAKSIKKQLKVSPKPEKLQLPVPK